MRRSGAIGVGLAALAAAVALSACGPSFDDARSVPATTLGQDLYGLACARVAAGALAEDLDGASWRRVCQPDPSGAYADRVDASLLPPARGDVASRARALGIAKVEAMARRRAELVAAIDATFPDVLVDDPAAPGRKIRLHDALAELTGALAPLYESDPFDPAGEPLVPATSRAIGRLFDAIASSPEVQGALARMSGRVGYRPLATALGAIRPALAYPGLRSLAQPALRLLGAGGPAAPELDALLVATRAELATATADGDAAPLVVDASRAQPSRPRTDLEILRELLLTEDDAFADPGAAGPRFIAARDARAYALLAAPGVVAPFHDGDGDGLPDVDDSGRFVGADGAPLAIDAPFATPEATRVLPPDPWGRAVGADGRPIFRYVDTTRTLGGTLGRELVPLVDADPANDHETVMDALAGAAVLSGDRVDATRTDPYTLSYRAFDPATSPLPDLLHAFGQLYGDRESDDWLELVTALFEQHPDLVARLLGDAQAIYANANDPAKPLHAAARLDPRSTIWDEIAAILGRMASRGPTAASPRTLYEDLVVALADDRVLALGQAFSAYSKYRDRFSYDPDHLNGPPKNVASNDLQPPHVPVDRSQVPWDAPGNQSELQSFFRVLHEAAGVKACNKAGAVLEAQIGPIPVRYPAIGGAGECDLFQFDDLAVAYLRAVARRGKLTLRDPVLAFLGGILPPSAVDSLFVTASGIEGLSLNDPTPAGLTRLVFFAADSTRWPSPPDLDPYAHGKNATTNRFVSNLIDPVPSAACPKGGPNQVNQCASFADTLRGRVPAILFLDEEFGALDGLQPIARAFVDHGADQDFLDLVQVFFRHWPTSAHGPECTSVGDAATNPEYCNEDGAVAYEPILEDAFASDLVPAVHELAKVLVATKIGSPRVTGGTRTGAELLASLAAKTFDPAYAASVGTADRAGAAATAWSDGTPQPQTTPFDLLARALVGMDRRFEGADGWSDLPDRKAAWKRSRSQLVDRFLLVDGAGSASKFHQPALPRALSLLARLLREQVNARCPDRESTGACAWATRDLARQLAESMGGPVYAGVMDVLGRIREDEPSRRELERFLAWLLSSGAPDDPRPSTLASLSDLLQILRGDESMAPILAAVSQVAEPAGSGSTGAAPAAIDLLKALTDPADAYDRHHAIDAVLRNLVTPIGEEGTLSPIEVFVDTIADVNRIDASIGDGVLSADDQEAVASAVREFMLGKTRGLEQLYEIVRRRNGD